MKTIWIGRDDHGNHQIFSGKPAFEADGYWHGECIGEGSLGERGAHLQELLGLDFGEAVELDLGVVQKIVAIREGVTVPLDETPLSGVAEPETLPKAALQGLLDSIRVGLEESERAEAPIVLGIEDGGVVVAYHDPHPSLDQTTRYRVKLVPVLLPLI